MGTSEGPVSPELRLRGMNLRVDTITLEVFGALSENGIRCILLKGPTLAWLYQPDQTRAYTDTDILIAPTDVAHAEGVMTARGFYTLPTIPGDRPWIVRQWLRDRDGANVEIHRGLPGIRTDLETAWRHLSEETEHLELRGKKVETLSQAGKLLFVGLHSLDDRDNPNKHLRDVDLAAAKAPIDQWKKATALAKQLDALPAFSAGLRRTNRGADLADRLQLPHAMDSDVAAKDPSASPFVHGLQWLIKVPGLRAKARLVVRKAFPPPEYIRWWFPPARRNVAALVAGYLWRPFWLLWKATQATWSWIRLKRRGENQD